MWAKHSQRLNISSSKNAQPTHFRANASLRVVDCWYNYANTSLQLRTDQKERVAILKISVGKLNSYKNGISPGNQMAMMSVVKDIADPKI
ncbi:hypothetical protein ACLB1Q_34210 [Escherichia coli]